MQDKWRRTEECSPSEDALLWVWSVTKAVLTWPQLVMDATSLFKTSVLSLSVCIARRKPPKTTTHPPYSAEGLVKPPNGPKTFLNVQAIKYFNRSFSFMYVGCFCHIRKTVISQWQSSRVTRTNTITIYVIKSSAVFMWLINTFRKI